MHNIQYMVLVYKYFSKTFKIYATLSARLKSIVVTLNIIKIHLTFKLYNSMPIMINTVSVAILASREIMYANFIFLVIGIWLK